MATHRAEIVVVGAGYAGLMAALTLAQAGRDVVLIDAQPIGGNDNPLPGYNQSSISGGHVTYGYAQDYDELARQYGEDYARALFGLSVRGVDLVEANCQQYDIKDAAFRRGYLILARNGRDESELIAALNATEKYGDFIGVERLVSARETGRMLSSPSFQSCSLYSPLHGQLEPQAYIKGLARAAMAAGVRVFGETRVKQFRQFAYGVSAIAENGDMFAGHRMIISGGTRILRGGHFPLMRKYQATVGNYAVKTNPISDDILQQIFPTGYHGAFADLRRADVLYARLDWQNCLDFGAFSFGGARPNAQAVENLLYATFPQLRAGGVGISHRRYGFLAGTRQQIVQIFANNREGDVVPVRSYDPASRLFILSAFAAEGINLGTTTGRAMANALLGDPTDFNILAHIEHPPLPITFPWESANRIRDWFLATTISVVDRTASTNGISGIFARAVASRI